ncbi:type II toxin-antitoxin system Phd/YefM family antitoxin [Thiothrix subterranea]|uniref:type II toxin-antitoxin system Phd/YefM family antitoxin n=1 Tax=Thiothrix subterranea TaxID=2735563 RepID=UPI00192A7CD4|nr:type II toxin-antitoxin system Phd/YefM family antitoxin [Thiothrix subterranea]QQZ28614.1 type II toxin-antitoxin system Phd/YefM family antitoxin [Thiothrix subterranea]
MQTYSIAEAKNQLPRILRDLTQVGEVHLTRYGKPIAILLSAAQYQALQRRQGLTFSDVLANVQQHMNEDVGIEDTSLFDRERHQQHDRDFAF